jgi:hypothetical protein
MHACYDPAGWGQNYRRARAQRNCREQEAECDHPESHLAQLAQRRRMTISRLRTGSDLVALIVLSSRKLLSVWTHLQAYQTQEQALSEQVVRSMCRCICLLH